jgi:hypothetical protein
MRCMMYVIKLLMLRILYIFLAISILCVMGQSLSSLSASHTTSGTTHFRLTGTTMASSRKVLEKKVAALFGMYVADSVAMPVHWMYSLSQLRADYGSIKGYVRPNDKFVGSIMNLSNTGASLL